MTVIVLDTDDDSVVLTADRQWTDDTDLIFFSTKICPIMRGTEQIGAVATCGDARKGLQFEELVVTAFKKTVNSASPREQIQKIVDEIPKKKIPDALIVIQGAGYSVDEDGLVLPRDRWSIGSGSMVALGAMWNRKGTARRLATLGCKAAIELHGSCGGKIDIFEMPRYHS